MRATRVEAAEMVQVEISHRVHRADVALEGAVALEKPGVLLRHEELIVGVRPKHVSPLREAVVPCLRPVGEAFRQMSHLRTLV